MEDEEAHGRLTLYRSKDTRYRSGYYIKEGKRNFCVAEKTLKGTLITEFLSNGEVVNQVYDESEDAEGQLRRYLGASNAEVKDVESYEKVAIRALCGGCSSRSIYRQLDIIHPSTINEVSVIPIYLCSKCGKRYYSLTHEYLKYLVNSNRELFGEDELEEAKKDEHQFINTLQEYIIRIFAAKKMSRINIEE